MTHATADAELLYPLSLFRQTDGEELPAFEVVEAEVVPPPYHGLLVHAGDMTSRLAAHHGGEIVLEVLHTEGTPQAYRREVVLRVAETGLPVEYGAIEIFTTAFPPGLRLEIMEQTRPLGALLNQYGIAYRSQPKAFIKLGDDAIMHRIFGCAEAHCFYGRCNELLHGDGQLLARIVEVLPP